LLTLRRLDPINEPPRVALAKTRSLDRNLTVDEVRALRLAIERDGDPTRLDGLADAFEESPIASTLARAKAVLERIQRTATPEVARISGAREGRAPQVACSGCRRTATSSLVGASASAASVAAQAVDALEVASADLGPEAASVWKRFEPAIAGAIDAGGWDPSLLAPLSARTGAPSGLSSNTAIALLAATRGPDVSLVARPSAIGPALAYARSAGGSMADAIASRRQAARARLQIDRQNWVRWFNASAAAGLI
jgi:hypothetical protein